MPVVKGAEECQEGTHRSFQVLMPQGKELHQQRVVGNKNSLLTKRSFREWEPASEVGQESCDPV